MGILKGAIRIQVIVIIIIIIIIINKGGGARSVEAAHKYPNKNMRGITSGKNVKNHRVRVGLGLGYGLGLGLG